MSIQRTSTCLPPATPHWKYDVFPSFRGEDTRKGFIDHLYSALEHQGIVAFKDDPELEKGRAISPQLLTAIEESRYALIVVSRNYASSTWCLDELLRILECMEGRETVMPIFYDVDPCDVRKQTGTFSEAFTRHEERFRDDTEKVQRWRYALTEVASFSGWNSKAWYESKLIKDIVEVMWTKLRPTLCSSVENVVGIDSRLQPINFLLGGGVNDVRFIGIWGMGGIGKTTIARVVYKRISHEFDFSILLTNVRSNVEKSGLVNLQKKLLSGIWMKEDDILDLHQGAAIIRRFCHHKKVLLILDDVSHPDHLNFLAAKQEWFGIGSRVIITTRNEHLLIKHGVERRFKVWDLNNDKALQLFSRKAFRKDYPQKKFLGLSNSVVNYANGLPLAVEVLGASLNGRGITQWKSLLSKLGKVCNSEIFDVLKMSYDCLDDEEKKIFLDIACFFNGEDKDRLTEILIACDVSAVIGIKVLIERSLLIILGRSLWMHDLLREMGLEIVRRESPNELGRRSRLWLQEDANHVLSKNTGTEAIEGIVVPSTEPGVKVEVNSKSFLMLNKLRYLEINNVNISKGLEYLPNSLRILDWTGYPLKSLPSHFNPAKLLELNMRHSCIKHLGRGLKPLYNLNRINLSHSLNLVNTPDFRGMLYLEFLILEGCTRLYEVDPSIGVLERLSLMNLKDCKNLVRLPSSLHSLRSLKFLNLSGCSKIKSLSEQLGCLECLEKLDVSGTAISELPSSISLLKNLKDLSLRGCKGKWPKSWNVIFHPFQSLLKRILIPTALSLPSLSGLHSLTKLDLSDCNLLDGSIPSDLGCLSSLIDLNLSKNQFVSLPGSMCQLSRLKYLRLEYCHRLQSLSELPSGSDLYVDVANCTSLVALSDPIKQCNSGISANCLNCFKLVEKKRFRSMTLSLLIGDLQEPKATPKCPNDEYCRFDFVAPEIEILEWFNHQSVGSSVSIELHPGWFSSKWMGFALCAVFADKELSSVCSDAMIVCKLKVNGEEYLCPEPSLPHGKSGAKAVSDHLWLLYVPADRYFKNDWQDIYYKLEFSFWFKHFAQGCEALEMGEVKKCGIYMVYKKDVEKLKQRYWQGNASISEETLDFPDCNFRNVEVITEAVSSSIITKRSLEHYGSDDGEAGLGSAGSSCIHQEQEPGRKRLKQLDDGAGPGGNA